MFPIIDVRSLRGCLKKKDTEKKNYRILIENPSYVCASFSLFGRSVYTVSSPLGVYIQNKKPIISSSFQCATRWPRPIIALIWRRSIKLIKNETIVWRAREPVIWCLLFFFLWLGILIFIHARRDKCRIHCISLILLFFLLSNVCTPFLHSFAFRSSFFLSIYWHIKFFLRSFAIIFFGFS